MTFRLLLVGCLFLTSRLAAAETTALSRLASCLAGTFTNQRRTGAR